MLTTAAALALAMALQTGAAPSAPPPPLPADQPITHIVQNLGRDLAHLPSIETLEILGAGAGAAAIAHPADARLANWAADQGTSTYTSLGARLGDGWTQGGAALGTYAIGLVTHNRMATHIGSDLIRAQVLNAVLTRGLKAAVGRPRPGGGPDSMPSGHTTASFTSAAVLEAHFGWKAGVPAFAMASFVGWSRIRDHEHFLTDVVVGAAIGVVAGRTVTAGHRGRAWAVIPVASGGTAAVYVVRVAR